MPIEHPFIDQQPDEVGEAEPGEHYGSGLLAADVGVGWTESGRAGARERGAERGRERRGWRWGGGVALPCERWGWRRGWRCRRREWLSEGRAGAERGQEWASGQQSVLMTEEHNDRWAHVFLSFIHPCPLFMHFVFKSVPKNCNMDSS